MNGNPRERNVDGILIYRPGTPHSIWGTPFSANLNSNLRTRMCRDVGSHAAFTRRPDGASHAVFISATLATRRRSRGLAQRPAASTPRLALERTEVAPRLPRTPRQRVSPTGDRHAARTRNGGLHLAQSVLHKDRPHSRKRCRIALSRCFGRGAAPQPATLRSCTHSGRALGRSRATRKPIVA
jgi:hypothetical protein